MGASRVMFHVATFNLKTLVTAICWTDMFRHVSLRSHVTPGDQIS